MLPLSSAVRRALPLLLRFALPLLSVTGLEAQTPRQPAVLRTGNWPAAVYTADVNSDGIPDLIYIDQGATQAASTTHVMVGDGKGGFRESAHLATGGSSLAIGDLYGQGHADLAYIASSVSGNVANVQFCVAPGDGTGSFGAANCTSTPVTFNGTAPIYGYLTAGRLTPSGPFVAFFEQGLFLNSFRVNGATVQLSSSSATLPAGIGPLTVADLNGDGFNDFLITSNAQPAASILLNHSATAFSGTPTVFSGTAGVQSLLVQDVTGDGVPDLIAEGLAGRVDVFVGNGDGTFQTTPFGGTGTLDGTSGNGGHLIVAADLNHDGLLDALTATPAGISTLLGAGTGYLGLKGIFNAGPGRSSYAAADFNRDGNLDLAVDSPEGIAILYGNADGSFQTSQAFATGQPAESGALGKFTGSGHLDVAVGTASAQAQLLLGQGDGTFVAQPTPTSSASGLSGVVGTVQAGDFNGDGKLDLAITADGPAANLPAVGQGTGLVVQMGDGQGGFAPPQALSAPPFQFPTPSYCPAPFDHYPGLFFGTSAVADFNHDGIADIANLDAGAYRVLAGRAGATSVPGLLWSQSDDLDLPGDPFVDCDLDAHDRVVAGDLNNDGSPDLVFQDEGHLIVFTNDGTGHFSTAPPPQINVIPDDLANPGSTLISPGSLPAPQLSTVFDQTVPAGAGGLGFPAFVGSAAVADLDGDGNNDLLVTYANLAADRTAPNPAAPNYLYLWYGSGGGSFLTSAKHPVNPVQIQLSRNYYEMAVADLNGDGVPDLVLSDGYLLDVQYGVGDGTFGAEQHLLAGQGLNSIMIGDVNGDGAPDLVLANGGTVFGNPAANLDGLVPNPDVSTGGITVLLGSKAAPATPGAGSLTALPEPSPFEGTFTITATSPDAADGGSFAFTVDGANVGMATVQSGAAVLTVPAYLPAAPAGTPTLPGDHVLGATYAPASSGSSFTLKGTHTVSLGLTAVTLTPTTPLTTSFGGPVNGIFSVISQDPAYPPTGTWTQLSNGVPVPGCTQLSLATNTQCPYGSPNLLDAGTYTFVVQYNGDAINGPAQSQPITYVVNPDSTSTTLISSLNPANAGAAVTFTAAVSSAGMGATATPSGTVQFLDAGAVIGTGTLDASGHAIFTTSTLAVGTHPITASFAATQNFLASVSTTLNQVILPNSPALASTITLTSSLNPSAPGQPVTFSAQLSLPAPALASTLTGAVSFLDGGVLLGTGPIQNGAATFTTSTLALGSHPVTATYAGAAQTLTSAAILGSTSPVLTQVVAVAAAPQFSLIVTPSPIRVEAGANATLAVTVNETGGFNMPVALTCSSSLPYETSCVFLQPLIPAGGGTTTLLLETTAPHACGSGARGYGQPGAQAALSGASGCLQRAADRSLPRRIDPLAVASMEVGGPLLAGVLVLLPGLRRGRRRRRLAPLLAAVALLGGLAALNGCGGPCTDLGTAPGTYNVTVTGTASGAGGTATSATVQMNVFP